MCSGERMSDFECNITSWHWSHAQCQLLHASLSLVVAPSTWRAMPVTSPSFDPEPFSRPSPARPFPAALCAFFHALRVGAPWAHALDIFAALPDGNLSADGRISPLRPSTGLTVGPTAPSPSLSLTPPTSSPSSFRLPASSLSPPPTRSCLAPSPRPRRA